MKTKHAFTPALLVVTALAAACTGEQAPAVGIALPGHLRLAELDASEKARLEATLAIDGLLDERPLALASDLSEASGVIELPTVTERRTVGFTLRLWLNPPAGEVQERVLLARADGELTLEPHAANELGVAGDDFDVCGAVAPDGPCALVFDLNRNGAPNLDDLVADIDPLPPPPFVDAAPSTLQFPSGIRLGAFARQVIVVENVSARSVELSARLVDAPGVTLSRYETIIAPEQGARRALDLGVISPFQEAFLAVSFAPVNAFLTTGAVYIEAYDAETNIRQATRVKIIANADGELQPPDPSFAIDALAEGAALAGYVGAVEPFPTGELFNGMPITGVSNEDVVSSGLPYTGKKMSVTFDEERGAEDLPADAVFLVEVPPEHRLAVSLGGLTSDVDLAVLTLGDDDSVQAGAAANARSRQTGASPEAIELRNDDATSLRALVVLGRIESEPPAVADGALSHEEPTSFSMSAHISSAPEFTEPLAPTTGALEGGNRVLLTGRGFHPNATVTFADAVALDCSQEDLGDGITRLGCTAPPGSLLVGKNPATVVVANPSQDEGGDGQAATLPEGYTYLPPAPRLDDLSPRVAATSGSTTPIAVKGAFFSTRHGAPRVLFGQTAATAVTFIDASRLDVVAPASAAGVVSVTVQNRLEGDDGDGNALWSLPSNSRSFTFIEPAGPPPVLSGIVPDTGTIDGGAVVTLSGQSFLLGAQVTFDAVPSGSVTFVGDDTLTATVPARPAPGVVDIEVVNPDGQTARLPGAFSYYVPAPSVASVFPAEASTTGGTFVVVTGTGFRAGVQVLFTSPAGTPISSPNVNRVSTGTLLVATPAVEQGGDYAVEIVNIDGQTALYGGVFRYLAPAGPAPRIDTIDPPSGFKESPSLVTLTGSDFRGPPAILVGSESAEIASFTDNEAPTADVISFLTPIVPNEGPVVVRLINSDGQSDTTVYTYFTDLDAPPLVFQVTPAQGTAGDEVVVRGSSFDADDASGTLNEGAALLVRGGAVQPASATTSEVRFLMPQVQTAGPITLEITVQNGDGQRASGSFLYVPPSAPQPTITSVTPASAPVGASVVVGGTNFNVASVTVGNRSVAAGSFTSTSTQLSFTVPSGLVPSQALIRVTNADGQSASAPFTVVETPTTPVPAPVIYSVGPAELPLGGGAVTVTGASFSTTGGKVMLAGAQVAGATFTATSATFTAPAKAEGVYTLAIVNADNQSASTTLRYKASAPTPAAPPVIYSVGPSELPLGGGAVTVSGAAFSTTGGKVMLAGVQLSGATFTATSATFTAPAKAEGSYTLAVVNQDNQSASTTLRYRAAGTTTIAPVAGLVVPTEAHALIAGDVLTITGQGLGGVTSASIERSTGGAALGTVPLVSKNDVAVTANLTLALEDSDTPTTGTSYVVALAGSGFTTRSLPFRAVGPRVTFFDVGGEQVLLAGSMLNPAKLVGAQLSDGAISVPLTILGGSDTLLFASLGGQRLLPGASYSLTFSYQDVASPVSPFPPGAAAPPIFEPPLPLYLPMPLAAGQPLVGTRVWADVPDLYEYQDSDLGNPSTWTFTVTPEGSSTVVASGTWMRSDGDAGGSGGGQGSVDLTFASGTLGEGSYQVTLATERTTALAVGGASAMLPFISEVMFSPIAVGGMFAVQGFVYPGLRVVVEPTSGGPAEELGVVTATNAGGGPAGELAVDLFPTSSLSPGSYRVCALAPAAPLACPAGDALLVVEPHSCTESAALVHVERGGRFTLPLATPLDVPGYCGAPPMSPGAILSIDLPFSAEIEVQLVSAAPSGTEVVLMGEQRACSEGYAQCFSSGGAGGFFVSSFQLFVVDANGDGSGSAVVDVRIRLDGRCLRGDEDGDGFDLCNGDCAEGVNGVNPNATEVCNELDDNCNGVVDDLGPCTVGGQSGICAEGALECVGGSPQCNQTRFPGLELCGDSLDNDCDGSSDEGGCTNIGASSIAYAPEVGPFLNPIYIGGEDSIAGPFAIGFPFRVHGAPVTQFWLDLDGRVLFKAPSGWLGSPSPSYPDPDGPNGELAFAWTWLRATPATSALYDVFGTAPDRRLVIDVRGLDYASMEPPVGEVVSAQIILRETGSVVEVHTDRLIGSPSQPIVQGYENLCGTFAMTLGGRAGYALGLDDDAVRFVPADQACGDCVCEPGEEQSCALDCQPMPPSNCGNGRCETYEATYCPDDCGANVCGNRRCETSEDETTCPTDCAAGLCGNYICEPAALVDERIYCVQDCPGDYDSDLDGIPDAVESLNGSQQYNRDEDGDWLLDGNDPDLAQWDTDLDGEPDGSEVFAGRNPLNNLVFLTGCGNLSCDSGEDHIVCPADCWCGNGWCDVDETPLTCAWDCGGTGGEADAGPPP